MAPNGLINAILSRTVRITAGLDRPDALAVSGVGFDGGASLIGQQPLPGRVYDDLRMANAKSPLARHSRVPPAGQSYSKAWAAECVFVAL